MRPSPRAQRIAVPEALRRAQPATSTPGYEAAFRVDVDGNTPERSPEQWIRATFEEAPRSWRWFLVVGWTALTCRLRPGRSPWRVLGWDVEQTSPQIAAIAVGSWIGITSRIVVTVDADAIVLGSFVGFSGPTAPVARAMWAMTTPLHERILPLLLSSAVRRHQH